MCLWNPKVKKVANKVRVFKFLLVIRIGEKFKLVSPVKTEHEWKIGKNISNRKHTTVTSDEKIENSVYLGFHVYHNRETAGCEDSTDYVPVAFTAYKKDYVCSGKFMGDDCSVYTQLTLEKREYERAISKAKEQLRRE